MANDRDDYRDRSGRDEYGRQDYNRGEFGRSADDRAYRGEQGRGGRYYGSQSSDRDFSSGRGNDDRSFVNRAGDEVRSWFGDAEAERRRERDAGVSGGSMSQNNSRRDYVQRDDNRNRGDNRGDRAPGFVERAGEEVKSWFGSDDDDRGARGRYDGQGRDGAMRGMTGATGASAFGSTNSGRQVPQDEHGYQNWRQRQIEALDRDYDEYRREHQQKFDTHFSSWRDTRQGQRQQMQQAKEHDEVVGSDGTHVGKVDHIRGDRILLAKKDPAAGGHHHSIPSSWIDTVNDGTVKLSKTANEAIMAWRDEENNAAMLGHPVDSANKDQGAMQGEANDGAHMLNRSFSGTY